MRNNQETTKRISPVKALSFAFLYISIMGLGMYVMHNISNLIGKDSLIAKYFESSFYGEAEMLKVIFWFEIIMVFLLIHIVKKYGEWKKFGFGKLNKKSLWWLFPIFFIITISLIKLIFNPNLLSLNQEEYILLFIVFLTTMLVGFSEEVMFRGIILRSFLERHSIFTSVMVSSVMFSLLHSVNYFGGLNPAMVFSQLILTFIFGLAFALIALRLNNIWPLIIAHFLWDLILFAGNIVKTDGSILMSSLVLINIIIILILSLKIKKEQGGKIIRNKKFFISILTIILAMSLIAGYFLKDLVGNIIVNKIDRGVSEIFNQRSLALEKEIKNLPKDFRGRYVFMGNPKSNKVVIYSQGGPEININNTEAYEIVFGGEKIKENEVLLVNAHQCQSFDNKKYKTREINFEEAKKCDQWSVNNLAEIIKFFKSQNKEVYVIGVSFGAFVVTDLLASHPPLADKYLIVVGRLNTPDVFWKIFSQGKSAGFKYDERGNAIIEKDFTFEEAGMGFGNLIAGKNTAKIAAGIGYKRFTELLKDKDLSKVYYFYGNRDEQVGGLNKEEVDFLSSKKVKIFLFNNKGHSETIDEFAQNYLKEIIFPIKY